ncbi:hypothetical protein, partial [Salmonella sp. s54836]|uniref:hypothetical protein n=1 Tax=Salmonella sp. s54836 TaxID=3159673 RepID=UPI0039801209
VFGFIGVGKFDLANFFGEETTNRITSLATKEMIRDRLENLFGQDEQFTVQIGMKMKEKILEDLRNKRKEEYQSRVGIALLFDRSGGKLTKSMVDAIAEVEVKNLHHMAIIKEIRQLWNAFNLQEEADGTDFRDSLLFDSFYHGFMAPYIGCYRCTETRQAFKALDVDNDGSVDWEEFLVYIKWALHEYPRLETADEVMATAFEKGLIPAMRDIKVKNPDMHSGFRHNQCND